MSCLASFWSLGLVFPGQQKVGSHPSSILPGELIDCCQAVSVNEALWFVEANGELRVTSWIVGLLKTAVDEAQSGLSRDDFFFMRYFVPIPALHKAGFYDSTLASFLNLSKTIN